ncbi:membrane protein [Anopheles sinensis]|uniref:Membrane protein n=1 Tax=Anopheles sinensis TaxID=74873 RepID=A0A084VXT1_ANOSI|nr:membrane protein [Anopheles sinensis]
MQISTSEPTKGKRRFPVAPGAWCVRSWPSWGVMGRVVSHHRDQQREIAVSWVPGGLGHGPHVGACWRCV